MKIDPSNATGTRVPLPTQMLETQKVEDAREARRAERARDADAEKQAEAKARDREPPPPPTPPTKAVLAETAGKLLDKLI